MCKILRYTFGAWFLFSLIGCTQLLKPPAEHEHARFILSRLMQQNKGLTKFKGLANVQMISEGQSQSGRVAFAALLPDKMRIELLNMTGTPLTSIAGDGKNISILSHVDNNHYQIRQSRNALDSIIHLPIGLEDLQSILCGRTPLQPHLFAQIIESNGQEDVVLLKNRWHTIVSKLKVTRKTHQIQSMQVYDREGALKYRIQWLQWTKIGDYTLPSKVVFDSLRNQNLILQVKRFWPNAEVPPSTFIIDLPGHKS